MPEFDLDTLKSEPVPAPRPEARAAALAAAMLAYEAAGHATRPEVRNFPEPAKEPDNVVRLKRTSTDNRRFSMFARGHSAAMAATFALLVVGFGAVYQSGLLDRPGKRLGNDVAVPGLQTALPSPRPDAVQPRPEAISKRAPGQLDPAEIAKAKPLDPRGYDDRDPPNGEAGRERQRALLAEQHERERQLVVAAKQAEADRQKEEIARLGAGRTGEERRSAELLSTDDGRNRSNEAHRRAAEAATPAAEAARGRLSDEKVASAPPMTRPVPVAPSPVAPPRAVAPRAQRDAPAPGARSAAARPELAAGGGGTGIGFTGQQGLGGPAAASDSNAKRKVPDQVTSLRAPPEPPATPVVEQGRDRFATAEVNPVKSVAAEPVSTFSIDVDTASYSLVRRMLNAGRRPAREAVRVEEMINYFPYAYAKPDGAETPFRPTVTVLPSPWNPANKLIHVAIKGYDLKSTDRPRANLVFLVDVSGSMAPTDRLPLLKNAFRMLLDNLKPDDTVAIVTYASGSDVRLAPTKVSERYKIVAAIESLSAGGSTHGAAGIEDAYRVAEQGFDKTAVNRVILATDGDWNVGITDRGQLQKFIEDKRRTGIYLSILGVGMGNHNDQLMQALAQNGNGAAAYIDTLSEARKVLVDEASSTLFPIARDVKIQVEFNPDRVKEYRLIGYETRALKREDFNNDKVDAGDIGSGHTVTAIYEITPAGQPGVADDLRYRKAEPEKRSPAAATAKDAELAFLKIRYKRPGEETSRLIELAVGDALDQAAGRTVSAEVRFSVAVAAFGELLRGSAYMKSYGFDDVIELANASRGDDPFGYRAEFVSLVRLAKSAQ